MKLGTIPRSSKRYPWDLEQASKRHYEFWNDTNLGIHLGNRRIMRKKPTIDAAYFWLIDRSKEKGKKKKKTLKVVYEIGWEKLHWWLAIKILSVVKFCLPVGSFTPSFLWSFPMDVENTCPNKRWYKIL